ncbi:hypothetical protein [Halomicrobium katesii]|uniref:hypothetical protein n=1 Tax=Halomicrobium katesii TaxID=437163 RepID=UPI00037AA524|nr:hypothetical protein [Halomicrobium katesii]
MSSHHDNGAIRTPDRLDFRIGLVAGLYVGGLLTPALVIALVYQFQLADTMVTIGLLGAVGTAITTLVAWKVSRWGSVVGWFNSTGMAVLAPALGVLSAILYLVQVLLYLGHHLSGMKPATAASFVGVVGFALGIGAGCLGGVLTIMARTRFMRVSIKDADVDVEWTAGWPLRDQMKCLVGVIFLTIPFFVMSFWLLRWWGVSAVGFLLALLLVGLVGLVSESTYRVTPIGLEQHRHRGGVTAGKIIPWTGFHNLTVTDDAIVLHRPAPHFDILASRRDLAVDEADVIEVLRERIDVGVR